MRVPTSSDLSSLKTPPLPCSFTALLHADYHLVKEPCDAWIHAVAQPASASASLRLQECLMPRLMCLFIPAAISRLRLVHTIKAAAWLLMADDDDDCPDMLGSNPVSTGHRADLLLAVLRTPRQDSSSSCFDRSFLKNAPPGFASKFAHMLPFFEELWQEIVQEMSPTLQARFISTMADYFKGLKVQTSFREQQTIPNVQSYIENRRQTSFSSPFFVLMEYALGIELNEATFNHSLLVELRNATTDYYSFGNDVVSCSQEIHMGDYLNLPSILYNSPTSLESSTSFQNSMDLAVQMTEDANNRVISLICTIYKENKNFEPSMVPSIYAFINAISFSMGGLHTWYYETARYKQAHNNIELQQVSIYKLNGSA